MKPSAIVQWNEIQGYLYPQEGDYLFVLASELNPGDIAVELGALQGRSTTAIALGCKESGARLHTVDTFLGSFEHQVDPNIPQPDPNILVSNLQKVGVAEWVNVIRSDTLSAVKDFADNSISLLFVDAAHEYEAVLADLINWFPKVKAGGDIVCHDIGTGIWIDVDKAVEEFSRRYPVERVKVEVTACHLKKLQ